METIKDGYDAALSFRRGEERGFTYFFKTLYPALLYFAYRIVNDRQTAEDAVGESFIRIWKRRESFNHHQVIKSWLYTTVRNYCLNKLQSRRYEAKRNEALQEKMCDVSEQPIINQIILAELISEVHKSLQVLPPNCRKIFEYLYIKGKTVRETSEDLHISISTVKNQKCRGLSIIRRKFPDLSCMR